MPFEFNSKALVACGPGYDEVHDSTWESRERLLHDARKFVLKYDADHGVTAGGTTKKKKKN